MAAKVRAGLPRSEPEASEAGVGVGHDGDSAPKPPAQPVHDPELEAEVQAISAWFEALPAGLQSYLDHEARHGRDAYANT